MSDDTNDSDGADFFGGIPGGPGLGNVLGSDDGPSEVFLRLKHLEQMKRNLEVELTHLSNLVPSYTDESGLLKIASDRLGETISWVGAEIARLKIKGG